MDAFIQKFCEKYSLPIALSLQLLDNMAVSYTHLMISIFAFRTGRMQGFVIFFMISFLKQNISADTCVFQFAIVFYGGGGYVDIDPSDGSVFMLDAINGPDRCV